MKEPASTEVLQIGQVRLGCISFSLKISYLFKNYRPKKHSLQHEMGPLGLRLRKQKRVEVATKHIFVEQASLASLELRGRLLGSSP